ncbi:tumor necrosis factor receptor superfamily member 1B [Myotis daubentonii]|uniref:tumor necrosis factor receptor superfamily member 1B n=1 Tax=Myotis daubentonii TaxID=98922 RepID=UPI0028737951|nr:tumor necrosis factor receptor superfamily member 1B [Myotis daubentonii]
MAPAALWAVLAFGLQLWAAGRAVPAQMAFTPHVPEDGSSCQRREYYDERAQMCCSMCPPGYHVQSSCTKTSDTVCAPCEDSMYTELWNWVPECLSCSSRCSSELVEAQACTRKQNRVCACRPGWYCVLKSPHRCQACAPLRKCPPGFGVVTPGTPTSNVVCAACAPGTFSDTASSTDTCRPHRFCESTAIPGNASMDAVCTSVLPPLRVTTSLALKPQAASTKSQPMEPTPGPSIAASMSVLLPVVPSAPAEGLSTGNISLPVGLIVGVTALGLLMIGLLNCVILAQKKKKPFCLPGDTKPHLPADKAQVAPGSEQQHLLTTAPSSSSSSLESAASASHGGTPTRNQPQAPARDQPSGSGEARAGSGSSESSPGGHGTHVNVTCIVNVCSSSEHSSRCSSQASSTTGNADSSPSGSPKEEHVPFSKEECPVRSPRGAPETLLQSLEEKPLNLGVPDAGMKPS